MADELDLFGLSESMLLKVRIAIMAVVLLAIASLTIWYGEWRADTVRTQVTQTYELALARLKVDAAKALGVETAKTLRLERDLNTAHARIEEESLAHRETSAHYEGMLVAAAARNAGRLRDPNAAGCGGGGGGPAAADPAGAGDRPGDGTEAGGLFSEAASRLLQRIVREADRINDAYAACRPDALTLRTELQLSPPLPP